MCCSVMCVYTFFLCLIRREEGARCGVHLGQGNRHDDWNGQQQWHTFSTVLQLHGFQRTPLKDKFNIPHLRPHQQTTTLYFPPRPNQLKTPPLAFAASFSTLRSAASILDSTACFVFSVASSKLFTPAVMRCLPSSTVLSAEAPRLPRVPGGAGGVVSTGVHRWGRERRAEGEVQAWCFCWVWTLAVSPAE